MNGNYLSGLADGESFFIIRPSIGNKEKLHRGFNIRWGINMRKDDKPLIDKIDNYFNNIGTYTERKDKHGLLPTTCYYVEGVSKAQVIIEHFDKYPLLGKKSEDYKYYKIISQRVLNKIHLNSIEDYLETVRLCDEMRLNRLKHLQGEISYIEALKRSSGNSKLYLEYIQERFPEYECEIQDIVQLLLKDWR